MFLLRNVGFFTFYPFRIRINANIIIAAVLRRVTAFVALSHEVMTQSLNEEDNMANDDRQNGGGQSQLVLDSRTKTKKPSMYKVIMLNDDYTPMEFVIHVLQQFFGRSNSEATKIMMNVHQRGVGVCGVYSFEVAESKAQKTMKYARQNEHPLQLQLEKE